MCRPNERGPRRADTPGRHRPAGADRPPAMPRRPSGQHHRRRWISFCHAVYRELVQCRASGGLSVRSHTTQPPPANGSGTVPPGSRPATMQYHVVEHGRVRAGLADGLNTRGIATWGFRRACRASESQANAASSLVPEVTRVVAVRVANGRRLSSGSVERCSRSILPRSSRRRAMILRWISAVPP